MDHESTLNQVVASIHDNSALNTAMTGWYGRAPLIFQGMDLKNRPKKDQCPAIEIDLVGGQNNTESDDDGFDVNTCYLSLILTIHDDTEVDTDLDRLREKAGVIRREAFRRMVTRAVIDAVAGMEIYVAGIEHTNNEIEQFPFWQVVLAVGFTEQITLGQDPFNE